MRRQKFRRLDDLKAKLESHLPLPSESQRSLREDQILRWTYNSNAIEGNTLSLMETKVVLEGITIGGKSLQEHFEAINHREAILYVEDLAKQRKLLAEIDIKSIHHLVLKNIDEINAGAYRKVNVRISGASHIPPDFLDVPFLMEEFIGWYKKEHTHMHPVELAARVHADFVKIHPFVDGNGRTSRLLMNLELLKAGFPAAILPVEKRLTYYQSLEMAHIQNNYEPFFDLMSSIVEESFKPYWSLLGEKE
ncbi:MAG: Fic family protein [Spirochaetia bacterium]|nr:Fic family protein [Spirochaetia bacterium]